MARSAMIRHAQRRTPATIVAILMIVIGIVVAWVGIEGLITGRLVSWLSGLTERASSTTWAAPTVIVISVVAIVIGIVLLTAALKPGKRTALQINAPDPGEDSVIGKTDVALGRSGLAKIVGAQAAQVDGVDSVAVSAGSGSVQVTVSTSAADPSSVRTAVSKQVGDRLSQVGFTRTPRVSTKVRTRK